MVTEKSRRYCIVRNNLYREAFDNRKSIVEKFDYRSHAYECKNQRIFVKKH